MGMVEAKMIIGVDRSAVEGDYLLSLLCFHLLYQILNLRCLNSRWYSVGTVVNWDEERPVSLSRLLRLRRSCSVTIGLERKVHYRLTVVSCLEGMSLVYFGKEENRC
jgi:hypothetical protein